MEASRVAVVVLGTNTTRVLVCDVAGGRIAEIERRTQITRLGQGVDATGRLDEQAKQRVRSTIAEYRELIDSLDAQRTVAVATSAMRDAEDGEEFRRELAERFGLEAQTISGGEEARLTFLGATAERSRDGEPTLLIDIGGGSTELVIGRPGAAPDFDVSTRAGAVRQTERHLGSDPPAREELHGLAEEVRELIGESVPDEVLSEVGTGIAVAGTATSLAAISQELDPYEPERVHGFVLQLGEAERLLAQLAALPLAERRELPGLEPERAPTIVAGAVILVEALRAFGLESVETSEADLLHGAALDAVARAD